MIVALLVLAHRETLHRPSTHRSNSMVCTHGAHLPLASGSDESDGSDDVIIERMSTQNAIRVPSREH